MQRVARVSVVDAGANWITSLEQREHSGEFRDKYASRFHSDLNAHLIRMWTWVDEIPSSIRKRCSRPYGSATRAPVATLGWNSIVRLAISVRCSWNTAWRSAFSNKKPLPELKS